MARQETPVLRLVDAPLKWGPFTPKSIALAAATYAGGLFVELATSLLLGGRGLLSRLPPHDFGDEWAIVVGLVALGALYLVERHEDQHYVPILLRYYLDAPWRYVYSGGCADRPRPTPIDPFLRRARR